MPNKQPKQQHKPSKKTTPKKAKNKTPSVAYNKRSEILMVVEGIPIRKTNNVSLYVPFHGMAELARIVATTGMSFAKALGYSSSPCECCKGKPVIVEYNGQIVEIPRGILNARREEIGNKKQKRK